MRDTFRGIGMTDIFRGILRKFIIAGLALFFGYRVMMWVCVYHTFILGWLYPQRKKVKYWRNNHITALFTYSIKRRYLSQCRVLILIICPFLQSHCAHPISTKQNSGYEYERNGSHLMKYKHLQNFSEAIEGQPQIESLLLDIKQMMGDKV